MKGEFIVYKVFDIASYICSRFLRENGVKTDEMKLHKLLYFSQRESIIQNGEPLFSEEFEAWKYGPVLRDIREHYKNDDFNYDYDNPELEPVMDKVFSEYSHILSWSLSMISHGEESWKKARKGLDKSENGRNIIPTDDIRKDAQRVKILRGI